MQEGLKQGMRGAFSEFDDPKGRRFIEIHVYNYDPAKLKRFQDMQCLEDSRLYTFLRLIKGEVHPNTRFLYKLTTYLGSTGIDDLWEFNERTSDLEEFGFCDIDSLLNFCKEKWNIIEADFKPIYETSIPH